MSSTSISSSCLVPSSTSSSTSSSSSSSTTTTTTTAFNCFPSFYYNSQKLINLGLACSSNFIEFGTFVYAEGVKSPLYYIQFQNTSLSLLFTIQSNLYSIQSDDFPVKLVHILKDSSSSPSSPSSPSYPISSLDELQLYPGETIKVYFQLEARNEKIAEDSKTSFFKVNGRYLFPFYVKHLEEKENEFLDEFNNLNKINKTDDNELYIKILNEKKERFEQEKDFLRIFNQFFNSSNTSLIPPPPPPSITSSPSSPNLSTSRFTSSSSSNPPFSTSSITSSSEIPLFHIELTYSALLCTSIMHIEPSFIDFHDCIEEESCIQELMVWNRSEIPLEFSIEFDPSTFFEETNKDNDNNNEKIIIKFYEKNLKEIMLNKNYIIPSFAPKLIIIKLNIINNKNLNNQDFHKKNHNFIYRYLIKNKNNKNNNIKFFIKGKIIQPLYISKKKIILYDLENMKSYNNINEEIKKKKNNYHQNFIKLIEENKKDDEKILIEEKMIKDEGIEEEKIWRSSQAIPIQLGTWFIEPENNIYKKKFVIENTGDEDLDLYLISEKEKDDDEERDGEEKLSGERKNRRKLALDEYSYEWNFNDLYENNLLASTLPSSSSIPLNSSTNLEPPSSTSLSSLFQPLVSTSSNPQPTPLFSSLSAPLHPPLPPLSKTERNYSTDLNEFSTLDTSNEPSITPSTSTPTPSTSTNLPISSTPAISTVPSNNPSSTPAASSYIISYQRDFPTLDSRVESIYSNYFQYQNVTWGGGQHENVLPNSSSSSSSTSSTNLNKIQSGQYSNKKNNLANIAKLMSEFFGSENINSELNGERYYESSVLSASICDTIYEQRPFHGANCIIESSTTSYSISSTSVTSSASATSRNESGRENLVGREAGGRDSREGSNTSNLLTSNSLSSTQQEVVLTKSRSNSINLTRMNSASLTSSASSNLSSSTSILPSSLFAPTLFQSKFDERNVIHLRSKQKIEFSIIIRGNIENSTEATYKKEFNFSIMSIEKNNKANNNLEKDINIENLNENHYILQKISLFYSSCPLKITIQNQNNFKNEENLNYTSSNILPLGSFHLGAAIRTFSFLLKNDSPLPVTLRPVFSTISTELKIDETDKGEEEKKENEENLSLISSPIPSLHNDFEFTPIIYLLPYETREWSFEFSPTRSYGSFQALLSFFSHIDISNNTRIDKSSLQEPLFNYKEEKLIEKFTLYGKAIDPFILQFHDHFYKIYDNNDKYYTESSSSSSPSSSSSTYQLLKFNFSLLNQINFTTFRLKNIYKRNLKFQFLTKYSSDIKLIYLSKDSDRKSSQNSLISSLNILEEKISSLASSISASSAASPSTTAVSSSIANPSTPSLLSVFTNEDSNSLQDLPSSNIISNTTSDLTSNLPNSTSILSTSPSHRHSNLEEFLINQESSSSSSSSSLSLTNSTTSQPLPPPLSSNSQRLSYDDNRISSRNTKSFINFSQRINALDIVTTASSTSTPAATSVTSSIPIPYSSHSSSFSSIPLGNLEKESAISSSSQIKHKSFSVIQSDEKNDMQSSSASSSPPPITSSFLQSQEHLNETLPLESLQSQPPPLQVDPPNSTNTSSISHSTTNPSAAKYSSKKILEIISILKSNLLTFLFEEKKTINLLTLLPLLGETRSEIEQNLLKEVIPLPTLPSSVVSTSVATSSAASSTTAPTSAVASTSATITSSVPPSTSSSSTTSNPSPDSLLASTENLSNSSNSTSPSTSILPTSNSSSASISSSSNTNSSSSSANTTSASTSASTTSTQTQPQPQPDSFFQVKLENITLNQSALIVKAFYNAIHILDEFIRSSSSPSLLYLKNDNSYQFLNRNHIQFLSNNEKFLYFDELTQQSEEFSTNSLYNTTEVEVAPGSSAHFFIVWKPSKHLSSSLSSTGNEDPVHVYDSIGRLSIRELIQIRLIDLTEQEIKQMYDLIRNEEDSSSSSSSSHSSSTSSASSSSSSTSLITSSKSSLSATSSDTSLKNILETNSAGKIQLSPRFLQLHGFFLKARLALIQRNIHYGRVSVGETTSRTITVVNKSPLATLLYLNKSKSIISDFLFINGGKRRIILPFSVLHIVLSFKPVMSGAFEEVIYINNLLNPQETLSVVVKAKVVKAEIFSINIISSSSTTSSATSLTSSISTPIPSAPINASSSNRLEDDKKFKKDMQDKLRLPNIASNQVIDDAYQQLLYYASKNLISSSSSNASSASSSTAPTPPSVSTSASSSSTSDPLSNTNLSSRPLSQYLGVSAVGRGPSLTLKFTLKNLSNKKRQFSIDSFQQNAAIFGSTIISHPLLYGSNSLLNQYPNSDYHLIAKIIKDNSPLSVIHDSHGLVTMRLRFRSEVLKSQSNSAMKEKEHKELLDKLEKYQQKLKISIRKVDPEKTAKNRKKIDAIISQLSAYESINIKAEDEDDEDYDEIEEKEKIKDKDQEKMIKDSELAHNIWLNPDEERLVTVKISFYPGIKYKLWKNVLPFLGHLRVFESKNEDRKRYITFGSFLFSSPSSVYEDSIPRPISSTPSLPPSGSKKHSRRKNSSSSSSNNSNINTNSLISSSLIPSSINSTSSSSLLDTPPYLIVVEPWCSLPSNEVTQLSKRVTQGVHTSSMSLKLVRTTKDTNSSFSGILRITSLSQSSACLSLVLNHSSLNSITYSNNKSQKISAFNSASKGKIHIFTTAATSPSIFLSSPKEIEANSLLSNQINDQNLPNNVEYNFSEEEEHFFYLLPNSLHTFKILWTPEESLRLLSDELELFGSFTFTFHVIDHISTSSTTSSLLSSSSLSSSLLLSSSSLSSASPSSLHISSSFKSTLLLPFICVSQNESMISMEKSHTFEAVTLGSYATYYLKLKNNSETEVLEYNVLSEQLNEKYSTRGVVDITHGKTGTIQPLKEATITIKFSATAVGRFEQRLWIKNLKNGVDQKRFIVYANVVLGRKEFVSFPEVEYDSSTGKFSLLPFNMIQIKCSNTLLENTLKNYYERKEKGLSKETEKSDNSISPSLSLLGEILHEKSKKSIFKLKLENKHDNNLFLSVITNLKTQCFVFLDEACSISLPSSLLLPYKETKELYIMLKPTDLERKVLSYYDFESSTSSSLSSSSTKNIRELGGGIRLLFFQADTYPSNSLEYTTESLTSNNHNKFFEVSLPFKTKVGKSILSIKLIENEGDVHLVGEKLFDNLSNFYGYFTIGAIKIKNESDFFPLTYFIYDEEAIFSYLTLQDDENPFMHEEDRKEKIDSDNILSNFYSKLLNHIKKSSSSIQIILFDQNSDELLPKESKMIYYLIYSSDLLYGLYFKKFKIFNLETYEEVDLSISFFIDSMKMKLIQEKIFVQNQENPLESSEDLIKPVENETNSVHNESKKSVSSLISSLLSSHLNELPTLSTLPKLTSSCPFILRESSLDSPQGEENEEVSFEVVPDGSLLTSYVLQNKSNISLTILPISDLPIEVLIEEYLYDVDSQNVLLNPLELTPFVGIGGQNRIRSFTESSGSDSESVNNISLLTNSTSTAINSSSSSSSSSTSSSSSSSHSSSSSSSSSTSLSSSTASSLLLSPSLLNNSRNLTKCGNSFMIKPNSYVKISVRPAFMSLKDNGCLNWRELQGIIKQRMIKKVGIISLIELLNPLQTMFNNPSSSSGLSSSSAVINTSSPSTSISLPSGTFNSQLSAPPIASHSLNTSTTNEITEVHTSESKTILPLPVIHSLLLSSTFDLPSIKILSSPTISLGVLRYSASSMFRIDICNSSQFDCYCLFDLLPSWIQLVKIERISSSTPPTQLSSSSVDDTSHPSSTSITTGYQKRIPIYFYRLNLSRPFFLLSPTYTYSLHFSVSANDRQQQKIDSFIMMKTYQRSPQSEYSNSLSSIYNRTPSNLLASSTSFPPHLDIEELERFHQRNDLKQTFLHNLKISINFSINPSPALQCDCVSGGEWGKISTDLQHTSSRFFIKIGETFSVPPPLTIEGKNNENDDKEKKLEISSSLFDVKSERKEDENENSFFSFPMQCPIQTRYDLFKYKQTIRISVKNIFNRKLKIRLNYEKNNLLSSLFSVTFKFEDILIRQDNPSSSKSLITTSSTSLSSTLPSSSIISSSISPSSLSISPSKKTEELSQEKKQESSKDPTILELLPYETATVKIRIISLPNGRVNEEKLREIRQHFSVESQNLLDHWYDEIEKINKSTRVNEIYNNYSKIKLGLFLIGSLSLIPLINEEDDDEEDEEDDEDDEDRRTRIRKREEEREEKERRRNLKQDDHLEGNLEDDDEEDEDESDEDEDEDEGKNEVEISSEEGEEENENNDNIIEEERIEKEEKRIKRKEIKMEKIKELIREKKLEKKREKKRERKNLLSPYDIIKIDLCGSMRLSPTSSSLGLFNLFPNLSSSSASFTKIAPYLGTLRYEKSGSPVFTFECDPSPSPYSYLKLSRNLFMFYLTNPSDTQFNYEIRSQAYRRPGLKLSFSSELMKYNHISHPLSLPFTIQDENFPSASNCKFEFFTDTIKLLTYPSIGSIPPNSSQLIQVLITPGEPSNSLLLDDQIIRTHLNNKLDEIISQNLLEKLLYFLPLEIINTTYRLHPPSFVFCNIFSGANDVKPIISQPISKMNRDKQHLDLMMIDFDSSTITTRNKRSYSIDQSSLITASTPSSSLTSSSSISDPLSAPLSASSTIAALSSTLSTYSGLPSSTLPLYSNSSSLPLLRLRGLTPHATNPSLGFIELGTQIGPRSEAIEWFITLERRNLQYDFSSSSLFFSVHAYPSSIPSSLNWLHLGQNGGLLTYQNDNSSQILSSSGIMVYFDRNHEGNFYGFILIQEWIQELDENNRGKDENVNNHAYIKGQHHIIQVKMEVSTDDWRKRNYSLSSSVSELEEIQQEWLISYFKHSFQYLIYSPYSKTKKLFFSSSHSLSSPEDQQFSLDQHIVLNYSDLISEVEHKKDKENIISSYILFNLTNLLDITVNITIKIHCTIPELFSFVEIDHDEGNLEDEKDSIKMQEIKEKKLINIFENNNIEKKNDILLKTNSKKLTSLVICFESSLIDLDQLILIADTNSISNSNSPSASSSISSSSISSSLIEVAQIQLNFDFFEGFEVSIPIFINK